MVVVHRTEAMSCTISLMTVPTSLMTSLMTVPTSLMSVPTSLMFGIEWTACSRDIQFGQASQAANGIWDTAVEHITIQVPESNTNASTPHSGASRH
jgi:hypothetical protein